MKSLCSAKEQPPDLEDLLFFFFFRELLISNTMGEVILIKIKPQNLIKKKEKKAGFYQKCWCLLLLSVKWEFHSFLSRAGEACGPVYYNKHEAKQTMRVPGQGKKNCI